MSTFDQEHMLAAAGVNQMLIRNVQDVLHSVGSTRHVLQDFRPLTRSLGWQMSDLYWASAGVAPFVENEVPFIVTSNGVLSEDAAAVLFASCMETPPDGPLLVLELGAGSGLFARYFVDAFREFSAEAGTDFYEHLVYLVSDRSPRTVEQWMEKGLFAEHGGHVVPGICDALVPGGFRSLDGWPMPVGPIRAVIYNYSLDVLPASVVRQGVGGCEELSVRTSLVNDEKLLNQYTRLTREEIQAIAEDDDPSRLPELLPVVSLLQIETEFLPTDGNAPPHAEESLTFAPGISRSIVNHGAIASLGASLNLIGPEGFILVNDYGSVQPDQVTEDAGVQRFGRTTALGLNFAFIDHHFLRQGCNVLRPEGDLERPIHARLFSRGEHRSAFEQFLRRFSLRAWNWREEPIIEARAHRAAGRSFQAIEAYQTAIARRSRDWNLLGEISDYIGIHLRDFASAVEIARTAVMINPWYSTGLWNGLGDSLFYMGQHEAAHEAHMQAYRIDPRDPRTNLNLAFTLFELGSPGAALNAIAAGFASDKKGKYRENLLQKQQHILSVLTERWQGEQERMSQGIQIPGK